MMTINGQTEAELVRYINETPVLLSLLYDLDLMPEQTTETPKRRWEMLMIAAHFWAYRDALTQKPNETEKGA